MKLDFELTNQTKILIGILVVALIAALATQWGPSFYKIVSNPKMKTKRETLKTSEDLVTASKILKTNEAGLYQKTGIAGEGETTTMFEGNYPASVVRKKVAEIVKRAGIPNNYQINYEVVPGKKSERISQQARRNLVVFSYQEKLNAEKDTLIAAIEAELQEQAQEQEQAEIDIDVDADADAMDMFMDAWLGEADVEPENSKETEKSDDKTYKEEKEEKTNDKEEGTPEKPSDVESDKDETPEPSDIESNKDETPEPPDVENDKDETPEPSDVESDKDETPEPSDVESDKDENPEPSNVENDKDENPEPSEESGNNHIDADNAVDDTIEWKFVSLPDSIPISIRIELIELILPLIDQHLVGAEKTLFENHFFKTETRATAGFFGLGARKPTTEINFRPNSDILAKFTNLIDTYGEELDKQQLRVDFLKYMDMVQSQIEELIQKLQVAPVAYTPESYTVKMKFKSEIDKLVNLNKIIETTSKWLMVRDLQISVDHKENKINVDVLMIARVYQ